MLNVLSTYTCKGLDNAAFDGVLPDTVHLIITIIKIAIPIILIIFGMLDLGKAVMSNDEKEMKSSQTKFIKRILYAALVFFVVTVVQLIFGMLDDNAKGEHNCISCFVNGTSSCTLVSR